MNAEPSSRVQPRISAPSFPAAENAGKQRVLVADGDPAPLRRLLEAQGDLEIVGEAADGTEALRMIASTQPNLLVLDVELPGTGAFELLEALGPARRPPVILLASCDSFALRAFDACALDYLVKPLAEARFRRALDRARAHFEQAQKHDLGRRLDALLEQIRRPTYLERIAVRSGQRVLFVPTRAIDWIEADANYVRLHVGTQCYVLRESVSGMASKLNPDEFVRIRRSTIVNIGRIKELQSFSQREDVVVLQDGTKLMASRGFRSQLRTVLGTA